MKLLKTKLISWIFYSYDGASCLDFLRVGVSCCCCCYLNVCANCLSDVCYCCRRHCCDAYRDVDACRCDETCWVIYRHFSRVHDLPRQLLVQGQTNLCRILHQSQAHQTPLHLRSQRHQNTLRLSLRNRLFHHLLVHRRHPAMKARPMRNIAKNK